MYRMYDFLYIKRDKVIRERKGEKRERKGEKREKERVISIYREG